MYRTSDPRFRRRLNEIGASVENATEQAQSGLYIFGERYIRPCFDSVSGCFTTCIDAGCPTLNLRQRERLRRQRGRGRSRGRAELNFDFYDDWDDLDETDGLLGWGGSDEFDRLLAGSGATGGYGSVTQQQPGRQRAMSYPNGRRKSAAQAEAADPTVIPGSKSFLGRLFGGKALRYKPSAADLQEHPGTRRLDRNVTEGQALLEEGETSDGTGMRKQHRRARSGTANSGGTTDSLSSRGDIFPSDEELDDAVPLDDEFAMVLERRNTLPGLETESSSGQTRSVRRGKRPSAGSRTSTRRTVSSRSTRSSTGRNSRRSSNAAEPTEATIEEQHPESDEPAEIEAPTLNELKQEERQIALEDDAAVERKRQEALKLAAERGLPTASEELPSKEATPQQASSPADVAARPAEEPSQLPTPLPTDDEEDGAQQLQAPADAGDIGSADNQDAAP